MPIIPALLVSLNCVVKHPSGKSAEAVGVTASSDKRLVGKPCIGVATMLSDGTLIYDLQNEVMGHTSGSITLEYKPGSVGYGPAIETIGGINAGEMKVIPPSPPNIGVASMSNDGTLSIQLRISSADGAVGEGLVRIKPGDPRYDKLVRHIGIKPGQVKPVLPWDTDFKH